MARPTKYEERFVEEVANYLKTTGREQTSLPTREGFALHIGVNGDTLVEWEKIHKEFSAAIKEIDERQKHQLMEDGLYGGKEINSPMAIFLLKANHKMIETSHTDITSQGEKLGSVIVYKPEKNEE